MTLTFADEPIVAALDDANLLAAMARFEAALALASARAGVLPVEDAGVIARVSDVRYHRELTKIFAKPTTGQRLTNIELKIVATASEEFAEHIRSEMPRCAKVIRDTGAKTN